MTDYTDLKARLRARAGKWVEERFGGIVWVLDDPDLPAEALVAIEELEQRSAAPAPDAWVGCGECDVIFPCHEGQARCIRLEPTPAAEPVAWRVDLSCCGRDEGAMFFPSWELADQFRNSYTSGPGVNPTGYSAPPHEGGHKRAGIISALYAAPQPAQADEARELLHEAEQYAPHTKHAERIRSYLARTGGEEET